MLFYVLLSYGAKPHGSIDDHPAARSQLRLIRRIEEKHAIPAKKICFDYARRIASIDDLPNLTTLLDFVLLHPGVKVRIDDLSRLFRITDLGKREALLSSLRHYEAAIFSIRHGLALKDFSSEQSHNLLLHPEKSKSLALQGRPGWTDEAQQSSAAIRRKSAHANALALDRIREELRRAGDRDTLKNIAARANGAGLLTRRGKRWSEQNVARALKMLDKERP
ncbi:hypothetical protein [Maritimibacter alexandrii]|uniref:hypothetical protein n=1 Tax=Maritimibacter alexandrii TaxID=2570355 RepID=UPI001107B640|nr:hypothetical protein [Maritimibacter alexandrii]